MNNYRKKLIDTYFSAHYQYVMPKTKEEWNWVIKRIDLNFGDTFSSLPRDVNILDLACGVGYLECYLLSKGFRKIEAVDLSKEQIEVAKENLKKEQLEFNGKVFFQVADALQYLKKVRNDNYEVIALIDIIEHLSKEEVIELLEEVYRALKQSGTVLIRTTNMDNPLSSPYFYGDFTHETGFTINSLSQCLRTGGFKNIKINYEIVEPFPQEKLSLIGRVKGIFRPIRPYLIGKLLGINPNSLSENLVAVAQE